MKYLYKSMWALACLAMLLFVTGSSVARDGGKKRGKPKGKAKSGGAIAGGYEPGKDYQKVWQWNKKVYVSWPKKGNQYKIYTAYYLDGGMPAADLLSLKHRATQMKAHKGKPCAYDPRGASEKVRGYRYMWVFAVKGKTLTNIKPTFAELKDQPTKGCAKLNFKSQ